MDYETLASDEAIQRTIAALQTRNMNGVVVASADEALQKVKSHIPEGASIMNGTSRTLEQIGLIELLKSHNHGWNNLHERIVLEKDPAKQSELRKQALLSDYYLGSVHAIAETGEVVIASNSGSQLPHIVYSSPHLVFVVSTKKIVPTLHDALERLEKHVVPQEDARMMSVGYGHTYQSKTLILRRDPEFLGRKITFIFVKENLGF
jgi:L-lactate utilization protein LutC